MRLDQKTNTPSTTDTWGTCEAVKQEPKAERQAQPRWFAHSNVQRCSLSLLLR